MIGTIISQNEFMLLDKTNASKILKDLADLCTQSRLFYINDHNLILKSGAFYKEVIKFLH